MSIWTSIYGVCDELKQLSQEGGVSHQKSDRTCSNMLRMAHLDQLLSLVIGQGTSG